MTASTGELAATAHGTVARPWLFDTQGRLIEEAPCGACGYVLRGLRAGDACPECGGAVSESIGPGLLRYADPRLLARLRNGALLLVAAMAWSFLVTVGLMGLGILVSLLALSSFAVVFFLQFLQTLLPAVAPLLTVVGVWLLTPREFGGTGSRWTLRVLVLVALALALAGAVANELGMSRLYYGDGDEVGWLAFEYGVAIAAGLASGVALGLTLRWAARLAGRLPSRRGARRFTLVAWTVLLATLLNVVAATAQAAWQIANWGGQFGIATTTSNIPTQRAVAPEVVLDEVKGLPPQGSATRTLPDGTTRSAFGIDAPLNPDASGPSILDTKPDGTTHAVTVDTSVPGTSMVTEIITAPNGDVETITTTRDAAGNVTHQSHTKTSAAAAAGVSTSLSVIMVSVVLTVLAAFAAQVWAFVLLVWLHLALRRTQQTRRQWVAT